jgi:hypothetical protein
VDVTPQPGYEGTVTVKVLDLFKEVFDLLAFVLVTPEIIGRQRLQQYVDRFNELRAYSFAAIAAAFASMGFNNPLNSLWYSSYRWLLISVMVFVACFAFL